METSFPDPTHFLPVADISSLEELFVLSFSFWMTMTAYLYSLAWWRVFRTSPWTELARDLPLIDRTRSPRWIVPSWDATPFENTLWTYKKGNFNKDVLTSWPHTALYRPHWTETLYQNLQPVPGYKHTAFAPVNILKVTRQISIWGWGNSEMLLLNSHF